MRQGGRRQLLCAAHGRVVLVKHLLRGLRRRGRSTERQPGSGLPDGVRDRRDGNDGAACRPGGRCLYECAVAEGVYGVDCLGTDYAATAVCGSAAGCYELRTEMAGIFCPVRSACFTADAAGEVWASTNPSAGPNGWQPVSRPPGSASIVNEIACPSSALCVAVQNNGRVLLGAPPPSHSALRRLLTRELHRPGGGTRTVRLLESGRYRYSIGTPSAGVLTIRWTAEEPVGGQRTKHVLIAAARAIFHTSALAQVRLILTRTGRRLLHRHERLRIHVTGGLSHSASGSSGRSRRST